MATLPTAASSWPDMLAGVICESKRVVAAHPYHFLALSVLFLLPLSSLVVAAPSLTTFSPHSLPPPQSLLRHSFPFPSAADATLALSLADATLALSAALLVALSAATAVASSVRRGFFGRPVKLLPALRSIPAPLARLLLTLLASLLASLLPFAALLLLPPPPHPPRPLPPPPAPILPTRLLLLRYHYHPLSHLLPAPMVSRRPDRRDGIKLGFGAAPEERLPSAGDEVGGAVSLPVLRHRDSGDTVADRSLEARGDCGKLGRGGAGGRADRPWLWYHGSAAALWACDQCRVVFLLQGAAWRAG